MEAKNPRTYASSKLPSDSNALVRRALSTRTFSRGSIVEAFKMGSNLTTIAVKQTIIKEPAVRDHGARRFEKLFRTLFDESNESSDKPIFIWAATESQSLIDVIKPLRSNDADVFDWVVAHASFAKLSSPSAGATVVGGLNQLYCSNPNKPATLTANRESANSEGFLFRTHFQPEQDTEHWRNGPLCENLDKPPIWLSKLTGHLNEGHRTIHESGEELERSSSYPYFQAMGVEMSPLRTLLS